jgi:uncharacterized repeat protein (TIGR03803 family)
MTKRPQPRAWTSRICLQAASAARALAITFTLALLATPLALGQTFAVLYTFKGAPDGANPRAGLIQDLNGTLYGTTAGGGVTNCQFSGCGVAFKLDTKGKETVLHRFKKGPLGGGTSPTGKLVRDAKGNLYGSAAEGGYSCNNLPGCGAVFELDKKGKETVLFYFKDSSTGANPGGLIRDSAGNLYSDASGGLCKGECGLVFELSETGSYTVLHYFKGEPDGAGPAGGLAPGPAGTLYGTTEEGGLGYGTVFKVNQNQKETVLYQFAGGADGAFPFTGVARDSAGNLYGTTEAGGGTGCGGSGCGTVFELDKTGKETVLYAFTGGTDGGFPLGGLVRDGVGNLYGTTYVGGNATECTGGCGVVFKLDTTGVETVLHSFTGGADGANPATPLLLNSSGILYGTTLQGGTGCGTSGCGVVFKLTP